ncbi:heterokaryon incompatibility protein-domain-containing protein [Bisporella sp. PMI_857]|nr:heterokaryon incompatibility protein-domain-containing protein [Bisporella sp. PMI_857]
MRLINVKTHQVKEFIGNKIPWYAILSHTWEEEEVSFQDIQDLDEARQRKGFKKIEYLCGQAAEDGWDWAWMDTCCIDKTSSSELSEAINSMYKWYSEAMVCYVYLSDIESSSDWEKATTTIFTQPPLHPDFRPRWFRRGWTLQELIAPLRVHFYTADWCLLGSKKDLQEAIASMTGIATNVLRHEIHVARVPVATRLYWASGRLTTRKEDMAYCLLGVFDINMPLLYGEGAKSFDRLLEQILNVRYNSPT